MDNDKWWVRFKRKLEVEINNGKFYLKPDLDQINKMDGNLLDSFTKLTSFYPLHEETGKIMQRAKKEALKNGF